MYAVKTHFAEFPELSIQNLFRGVKSTDFIYADESKTAIGYNLMVDFTNPIHGFSNLMVDFTNPIHGFSNLMVDFYQSNPRIQQSAGGCHTRIAEFADCILKIHQRIVESAV